MHRRGMLRRVCVPARHLQRLWRLSVRARLVRGQVMLASERDSKGARVCTHLAPQTHAQDLLAHVLAGAHAWRLSHAPSLFPHLPAATCTC